jgi:hypothetical protein
MQSSTWSSTGRISTGGSIRPVGRMTCSAKTPPVCSISQAAGRGRDATVCGRIASHSSKRSGRLSMQDGRRKPYSASVALRRKSPRYMPPICGMVTWLSSTKSSALSGRYSNSVGGGSPGLRPVRIARIVLDAGAGAGGGDHLEVEIGALLQPLRLEQLAPARSAPQPLLQLSLMPLIACFSVGPRRHVVRVGIDA